MKIVDYSPTISNLNRQPKAKLTLEIITAALIFILPAIVLFILSP
ncbi:MAG: hypothetical protein WAV56_00645 [Microgenomates group bacterium]